MSVRVFTVDDLVASVRSSGGKLDPVTAAFILDGPEGFVERGLVARVEAGYVVTAKGVSVSRAWAASPLFEEAA